MFDESEQDPVKLLKIRLATVVDHRMAVADSFKKHLAYKFVRNFLPYYFMKPPEWRIALRERLGSDRVLPDFASIGAVRSGTTSLSDYIFQHPCVVLPLAKEIGLSGALFRMKAQMPTAKEMNAVEKKYGMAQTGFCFPVVPSLMFAKIASTVSSQMKMVVVLRNPVERAYAHWRWDMMITRRHRGEPMWANYPSFDEQIQMEMKSVADGGPGMSTVTGAMCGGYLQHSVYCGFMEQLYKYYKPENVLVIKSEDLFETPTDVIKQVYKFLCLPDYTPKEVKSFNSVPAGYFQYESADMMKEFFKKPNEKLYNLIGRDMGW